MESTPESLLKESAFVFQRSGRNLSSALLYAEVGKHIEKDPAVYTGMGAALAKSAEGIKGEARLELLTWATMALKRGLLLGQGTMFESPCVNWLEIIKEEMDVVQPDPMEVADLEKLLVFLDGKGIDLVSDLDRLSEVDRVGSSKAIAAMARNRFFNVILATSAGKYGEDAQRQAIVHIRTFGDTPEIRETLAKVAVHVDSYALQPELGDTMKAIDPEWAAQFD